MNGTRHHFFPRPRLPFNQDSGINLGNLLDPLKNMLHRGAFTDQIVVTGFSIQQKPQIMNFRHIVEEKYSSQRITRVILYFNIHPIETAVTSFDVNGYLFALALGKFVIRLDEGRIFPSLPAGCDVSLVMACRS